MKVNDNEYYWWNEYFYITLKEYIGTFISKVCKYIVKARPSMFFYTLPLPEMHPEIFP
jgi:hypothetical protein